MSRIARLAFVTGIAILTAFSLGGCDQLRSTVADFISPEKPEEALKSASNLLIAGQHKEAMDKAQPFADKEGPLQAQFSLLVARAAALNGDSDTALKYLAKAILPLTLNAAELMADSAFVSLQADMRFLQLITYQKNEPKTPNRAVSVDSGGDAAITINNRSTEVRAGDVVIKLTN